MDSKDRSLLVDVAVMYYLEGKTQSEISKEMFMSRPKVSRLLKKARDLNVVDIRINYESDDFNRLIKQVQHRFNVENVVVVKTLSSELETIKQIGKKAASEVKYHLTDGIKIGMSWGRTVKTMVNAFKEKNLKDIKVIELFGAVEYTEDSQEFLSIGYDFSKKVNGTYFPLSAPLYIDDATARGHLLENPIVNNTLQMIDDCDMIITSLGVVNSSSPQRIWDAHVSEKSRQELLDKGAVGYICAHFYDQDGNFIDHPINENVIGIKTESIKNKKILLVAGSKAKCKALYAVLKAGLINTLVSDDKTLRKIIEEDIKLRGERI